MLHSAVSESPFKTRYGIFRILAFSFPSGSEHAALVAEGTDTDPAPLVRIQSSCLTGTAFGAVLCDCAQQLDLAFRRVAAEQSGVVLYLDQEGRGHGLVEKVAQLSAISRGSDTVDAAEVRGVRPDVRDYAEAGQMLRHLLGERPVRLMTNNPAKMRGVMDAGVRVAERIPLETSPTEGNRAYLLVKKDRMGHLFTQV
jgi:3,4-dihydroxy 2-butanone 4-phosphate synthase/GTP cyclohydrolase II